MGGRRNPGGPRWTTAWGPGKPYIQSASGGRDNSREGAQVRLPFHGLETSLGRYVEVLFRVISHMHSLLDLLQTLTETATFHETRTSGVCQELGWVSGKGPSGGFYS